MTKAIGSKTRGTSMGGTPKPNVLLPALLVLLALCTAPYALTYSNFSLYEQGNGAASSPTNNTLESSATSGTQASSQCSIAATSSKTCWSATIPANIQSECSDAGTGCQGGLVVSGFSFRGWFYASTTSGNGEQLNFNVSMIDGSGTETLLCQSPSGSSGTEIPTTSSSGTQMTLSCTPASAVFVPSGFKLKVALGIYNSRSSSSS